NRRRIMVAVPDQNVILMEDFVTANDRVPGVEREQQIWTYRYAVPKPDDRAAAPTGVIVSTVPTRALVTWTPAAGAARYVVERAGRGRAGPGLVCRGAGGRRGVQRGPARPAQDGHAAARRAERRGDQGDRPVPAAHARRADHEDIVHRHDD